MPTITKQLKKQDFLNVITEAPMTRQELVEALEEYTFIPSYLDYLTEHFTDQGKIVRNADGSIQRKGKKASNERVVYWVSKDDSTGELSVDSKVLGKGEHLTKDSGWSSTNNAAVKAYSKQVFSEYKTVMAELNTLKEVLTKTA